MLCGSNQNIINSLGILGLKPDVKCLQVSEHFDQLFHAAVAQLGLEVGKWGSAK